MRFLLPIYTGVLRGGGRGGGRVDPSENLREQTGDAARGNVRAIRFYREMRHASNHRAGLRKKAREREREREGEGGREIKINIRR